MAEYLIGRGARANSFVLTMRGYTALVKGSLVLYPLSLHAKGPHDLTLMRHTMRGGDLAMELLELLDVPGLEQMKLITP